jgi:hypothetical protein
LGSEIEFNFFAAADDDEIPLGEIAANAIRRVFEEKK